MLAELLIIYLRDASIGEKRVPFFVYIFLKRIIYQHTRLRRRVKTRFYIVCVRGSCLNQSGHYFLR